MFKKVVFLAGNREMRTERREWIRYFLSLFELFTEDFLGERAETAVLGEAVELPDDYLSGSTLLIGHELSKSWSAFLDQAGATYLDIRVSPIRFMAEDNLFAVGSNRFALQRTLAEFGIPSVDIAAEARALKLSLRYRDLGQGQFSPGALVFFTEQATGPDSIHHGDELTLAEFVPQMAALCAGYNDRFFIARPGDTPADIDMLRSMGFRPASANIYAVLGNERVAAVAAIRSGIVSEAPYFDKDVHVLAEPVTLLWDGKEELDNAKPWFFNVSPDVMLSRGFWQRILRGTPHEAVPAVATRRPADLVRRALNNWNSTAVGITLGSQHWHETVGQHIADMRHLVQQETGFRLQHRNDGAGQMAYPALVGRWRWFSGERVEIEADGHVHSDHDYGLLSGGPGPWSIHWVKRDITDTLAFDQADGLLLVENQYGDGGAATRLD